MSWEGDFTTAGQPSLDKLLDDSFFSGPLVFCFFFFFFFFISRSYVSVPETPGRMQKNEQRAPRFGRLCKKYARKVLFKAEGMYRYEEICM